MQFKEVKLVEGEEKSKVEIEEQLIEAKEQQNDEPSVEQVVEETPSENELTEEKVLSYIKNRYDKQIDSIDQLFVEKQNNEELPEDVAAYFNYKKETGRSIEDFVKLNRNFGDVEDNDLSEYSYDEDYDDEKDIKKIKLSKKKAVSKAKKFFEGQKEKYKQPVESTGSGLSQDEKENLEAYRKYVDSAKTYEEEQTKKRDWFLKKTEEVFQDFKGFDFDLGDSKTITYKPSNIDEIKKMNSDSNNFINKFTNEEGVLTKVSEYHKAIAIASFPERFAKFFYEQGKSDATDDVNRKLKNVDMSERRTPEVTSKGGLKVRAVSEPSSKGLRIKSRRK
jgi:hypothetical protein